jgi:hypothetical protein
MTETGAKRNQTLWRDDSSSDSVVEKSLEFDPDFHKETVFNEGKFEKSQKAGGLFTCTENNNLIKARKKHVYADFKEMQRRLVDKMNDGFGASAFHIAWKEGRKYVYLACRAEGCPYKIWFEY